MRYWLMKSEPDEFSIADLERRGREPWGGVRNYQARNYMRDDMAIGDLVFFYHSSCAEPGVVGLATIDSAALPDPTQFDPASDYYDPKSPREAPRWLLREVAFKARWKTPVTLTRLRDDERFAGMMLLARGTRLSITPVEPAHAKLLLKLGK